MNFCDRVSWLYFVKIFKMFFPKIFPTIINLLVKKNDYSEL